MSFASGFKVGFGAVNQAFDEREKRRLREGLKRAGALEQETVAGGKRQATPEELARAQDYTQSIAAQDAQMFGLAPEEAGAYAPRTPTGAQQVVDPNQYRLGGLTRGTQFSPTEVNQARTEEMARVYEQQGMPEEAMRMRQLAQQQQLTSLQLQTAQRQQEFNTALQDVNKQKFDTPEARTDAILDVYRSYDPKGAAQLEASYTQNDLNKITLNAKKFEQNYKEARAKGVDSVIKWYDSVNDGFTLRREGNIIYRKDATTGQEAVFLQGTDDQIMMRMDAIAKPGGFLELATAQANIEKLTAQTGLARAQAGAVGPSAQRADMSQNIALADQFRKQLSDIDKELQNYTEGTPQYAALARQRNEVAAALRDINAVIRPTGLTRDTAAAPAIDAAREVARSGINPDTGKPFTASEKKEYERIFGEPFPTSKKTSSGETKPASLSPASRIREAQGLAPRIPEPPPKEITRSSGRGGGTVRTPNPAYAEWEKEFGERYRAQQR